MPDIIGICGMLHSGWEFQFGYLCLECHLVGIVIVGTADTCPGFALHESMFGGEIELSLTARCWVKDHLIAVPP